MGLREMETGLRTRAGTERAALEARARGARTDLEADVRRAEAAVGAEVETEVHGGGQALLLWVLACGAGAAAMLFVAFR